MSVKAGDKVWVTSYGMLRAAVVEKAHNGLVWVVLNGRLRWFHAASVEPEQRQ